MALRARLLLLMVLVIATAGLVYELSIATVASYLLGDSVRQFSLIIGVYLSALGLGAYLSRYVQRRLCHVFVHVELSAALVGGLSAPVLFIAHSYTRSFQVCLFAWVVLVGTLVGLELPLLIRILERHLTFRDLIARALTFDYAGALAGSLAFSLLLLPKLGLLQGSLLCGLLNASVGLASTWVLPELSDEPHLRFGKQRVLAVAIALGLVLGLVNADRILKHTESRLYVGKVVYRAQSHYQRIVLTALEHNQFELFLNGNLQFSSQDERTYHESLVHPAVLAFLDLQTATNPTATKPTATKPAESNPAGSPHASPNTSKPAGMRVLIGGGGDGLAVRELLKWPVVSITLVDLDPAVTRLARDYPPLLRLNQQSLLDPRVKIINQDAMTWVATATEEFDLVILDFPDPSNYSLGKLYSSAFYTSVRAHLSPHGVISVQSSSPLFARRTFWSTVKTLETAKLHVLPYHTYVPSFGEWGFVLASKHGLPTPRQLKRDLQSQLHQGEDSRLELSYLSPSALLELFNFPKDMTRVPVLSNHLNTQKLVQYYIEEWSRFD